MEVLVVGGGAREHTLCWSLAKSTRVDHIYCAPGNAGTAQIAENVPISAEDITKLAEWATQRQVGLTVVGPDAPLAMGLVDEFTKRNLRVFGPTTDAAEIEWSKCKTWMFLRNYGIPTAKGYVCYEMDEARKALVRLDLPAVIKFDGLVQGKGVELVDTVDQAECALAKWLKLGPVLVEEFLQGPELSVLAFTDGKNLAMMPPARDYKRIGEGDQGPMTGGMGAYSRPSLATPELLEEVRAKILEPTIWGMAKEGRPFKGVLYAGLMITKDGPTVLEYNSRFGDPETQVILPLLETDLMDVLEAVIDEDLGGAELRWKDELACGVVMASGGYPAEYQTGRNIQGLDSLTAEDLVFHAGTGTDKMGRVLTTGGRVLTTIGVAPTILGARYKAYGILNRLHFLGAYFRSDIARDDWKLPSAWWRLDDE